MQIPLDLSNISVWLAVTSVILLVTVILAWAYDGNATLLIDQTRLRRTAIALGILFLTTVAIRIYAEVIK